MLNTLAFNILADRKKINSDCVHLFLCLMTLMDLERFHILPVDRLAKVHKTSKWVMQRHLQSLVRSGLLVQGPPFPNPLPRPTNIPRRRWMVPTYQINPGCLLSQRDLERIAQEHEDQRARERLMNSVELKQARAPQMFE